MDFDFLISLLGFFFDIPIAKWSVTQKTNLTTQLQSGIRYFDMRVAIYPSNCGEGIDNSSTNIYSCFYIVHGQYANRVIKELKVIRNFLQQHPKEVVILDFQHFYKTNDYLKVIFKELVAQVS